jgi:putative membrane-bound dehydrogenase-like protein
MRPLTSLCAAVVVVVISLVAVAVPRSWAAEPVPNGNRLSYLDSPDPYYVSRTFPKLTTPMWVGEEGVDAVIILAIDDMRGHEKWEAFLRPVLERLKQIDGRAPVSIMTCKIEVDDPHLQQWLKEGVSLETHTVDHPCPLMADGNFERAKSTYDRCVDQMFAVPGNVPVAFRMPCCDSLNTPSPRFWAEVFNKTTEKGHFLCVDSSVFHIFTASDPALPRGLVLEADGRERFRKYLPFKSFVNTIEDYPYPYVIDRLCWEFPCVVPSDWEGFNIQKAFNPTTIADMKAAIDATVIKQGVFDLVFHPHGWIKPEQIVELIDHATSKYGKRVKFLTFKEALERINQNLLGGQGLRAEDGSDNGVRLIDVNNDGFIDVVIGNEKVRQTRVWSPAKRVWETSDDPALLVMTTTRHGEAGVRFGVVDSGGLPVAIRRSDAGDGAWQFDGAKWIADPTLLMGLDAGEAGFTARGGKDAGVRLLDIDGDGRCELIVGNPKQNAVFAWNEKEKAWVKLPFALPQGTAIADVEGRDAGLRFIDINEDGMADIVFSNDDHYGVHLFKSMREGWAPPLIAGKHGEKPTSEEIPKIVRNGTNNGMWVHSRGLWWRNESTSAMPDKVDRRSFNTLLGESDPTARSPQASLNSIRVAPGFQVELMAQEPQVQDPIAFAWGADGKLWVVEMGDYPLGVDGKGKPGGRVKFLESTKGDGHYDKATVFLDDLPFPTGVIPWRKGVIVTCAPDIFYAEDTKGDGKADVREVLYTGFSEGNQQHRVNGPVWGLDGWLYCANGHSGGRVKSIRTGEVVDIGGRDVRIRPDDGAIEAVTGVTQYGRARDDWGNWFGNDNSNPMFHFVLEERYLKRNPQVAAPPQMRVPVSNRPGAAPVFPISRTLARFNDLYAANHFTSACSAIVYRDDLFPPAFANCSYVSEPVHDLVHREVMSANGVTFKSERAAGEQESEFLTSTDGWFRPTMLQTGPDGALWVADMYRAVIEHPEWIPKDWQKRLDLRAGHELGRLYRVYPVGAQPRAIPRMDRMDTAGLVVALASSNGWIRDMAQMLLVQRRDPAAVALLRRQVLTSTKPLCRMQSLCTLEGLGVENAEPVLSNALKDAHPGVRRQAIRICEALLAKSPRLGRTLAGMTGDTDPQVRLQLACTLGYWDDAQAGEALGELIAAQPENPFLLAAVLSSVTKTNLDSLAGAATAALEHGACPPGLLGGLMRTAQASEAGAGDAVTMRLFSPVATPREGAYTLGQYTAAATMLDALEQQSAGSSAAKLAVSLGEGSHLDSVPPLFDSARRAAADSEAPLAVRVAATRLLGRSEEHRQKDVALLVSLLSPKSPQEVQSAAAQTLARRREAATPKLLLAGWKTYGPGLRAQVLDAILSRPEWAGAVLEALEQREILPTEIDAPRRQRLGQHRDSAVRERARKLLAAAPNSDRSKVVESYRGVLTLSGDAAHGRELFAKTCATCHRLGDVGAAVGPDLASIGNKSVETLLVSILDPNQAVEPRFVNYLVETNGGDSYSGVLTAESANSVTLTIPGGEQKTVLRADLKSLRSTGLSLMPDGLESAMSPQDVADVIAAVRADAPPRTPKKFEGNKPQIVKADDDGKLHLLSTNCEIYGKTLVLEKRYGNLGFWGSDDDEAVWSVQVPAAGSYAVTLFYACDESAAGNGFVLQCGGSQLSGVVAGTQNWDNYRRAKIGEISLPVGRQQIVLRATGKPKDALMDLMAVDLAPVPKAPPPP